VEIFFCIPPLTVSITVKSTTYYRQKHHLLPSKAPPITVKSTTYMLSSHWY